MVLFRWLCFVLQEIWKSFTVDRKRKIDGLTVSTAAEWLWRMICARRSLLCFGRNYSSMLVVRVYSTPCRYQGSV